MSLPTSPPPGVRRPAEAPPQPATKEAQTRGRPRGAARARAQAQASRPSSANTTRAPHDSFGAEGGRPASTAAKGQSPLQAAFGANPKLAALLGRVETQLRGAIRAGEKLMAEVFGQQMPFFAARGEPAGGNASCSMHAAGPGHAGQAESPGPAAPTTAARELLLRAQIRAMTDIPAGHKVELHLPAGGKVSYTVPTALPAGSRIDVTVYRVAARSARAPQPGPTAPRSHGPAPGTTSAPRPPTGHRPAPPPPMSRTPNRPAGPNHAPRPGAPQTERAGASARPAPAPPPTAGQRTATQLAAVVKQALAAVIEGERQQSPANLPNLKTAARNLDAAWSAYASCNKGHVDPRMEETYHDVRGNLATATAKIELNSAVSAGTAVAADPSASPDQLRQAATALMDAYAQHAETARLATPENRAESLALRNLTERLVGQLLDTAEQREAKPKTAPAPQAAPATSASTTPKAISPQEGAFREALAELNETLAQTQLEGGYDHRATFGSLGDGLKEAWSQYTASLPEGEKPAADLSTRFAAATASVELYGAYRSGVEYADNKGATLSSLKGGLVALSGPLATLQGLPRDADHLDLAQVDAYVDRAARLVARLNDIIDEPPKAARTTWSRPALSPESRADLERIGLGPSSAGTARDPKIVADALLRADPSTLSNLTRVIDQLKDNATRAASTEDLPARHPDFRAGNPAARDAFLSDLRQIQKQIFGGPNPRTVALRTQRLLHPDKHPEKADAVPAALDVCNGLRGVT